MANRRVGVPGDAERKAAAHAKALIAAGTSVAVVANTLGVSPNELRRWIKRATQVERRGVPA